MDKYLEYIKEKERQIGEIDQTVAEKKVILTNLAKEKNDSEQLITELGIKYQENEKLKELIINFPNLKIVLKKMFLLFGGVFILPPTLIIGGLALATNSVVLLFLTIFFDLIIAKKVISDYKDKLNELTTQIDGVTLDFLETNNFIIRGRVSNVTVELDGIRQSMEEINNFIANSDLEKEKLREDINHVRFVREEAIASHCEDILNSQFAKDEESNAFQKKLLPSNKKLN